MIGGIYKLRIVCVFFWMIKVYFDVIRELLLGSLSFVCFAIILEVKVYIKVFKYVKRVRILGVIIMDLF